MKKLLTLFCAVFFGINLFATDEVVTTGTDAAGHTLVPVGASTSALGAASYNYATQQIYLASELGGASNAGNIKAVAFHYKTGTNYANARTNWKLYINTTSNDDLEDNKFLDKGTLVYSSSSFNVPNADEWYTLTFSSSFSWNGTSNIVITIIDETNTMMPTSKSHWAYTTTEARSIYLRKGYDEDLPNPLTGQTSSRKDTYVANAKFTIEKVAPSTPATPTDLSAETTNNSATLSWSSVAGATLYKLQSSSNGSDWSELASTVLTSYDWTGLASETTYYVRIAASNASGDSDWSDAVAFTTDAVHSHDGITFAKWNSTNDIPSSGNYYLANDITIGGASRKTINGTLNLCLNGHTITFGQYTGMDIRGYGSVGTLALYDDVGGGLITGAHNSYTILVEGDDGSLSIHGGRVENSGAGVPISSDGHVTFDLLENVSNYATIAMADGVSNISIHMDRSFTSSQFNTICLPFTLYSDKLSSIFGSGYDLEEFVSSELIGEELVLNFTKVTQLDGGKPYLIKPAHNVVNPTFSGVDISALSPIDNTSDPYISFHGVFSPTELEGGNKNLLFLGANDELFWPAATGYLKGFRSYFEVKGAAQKVAKRASIIRNPGEAQGIQTPSLQGKSGEATKCIRDGRLIIERDGQLYNAQGRRL